MILLSIWFCLCSNMFVLAPPLLNINHSLSLENRIPINSYLSNTTSKMLIKRRRTKIIRTTTEINYRHFDINSYRSSWKFIDKNTIRVRFRLYESLLHSIVSTHFLVRHVNTGHISTFNEPHDIINSTVTLYLHNLKHGRHTVCLLLYRAKLMINPKYIFCQDIVFNFHRYGKHDIDSDEHGNTLVFLLTQYSFVLGILCILQLVHAARKRRLLRTVYGKANAIRNQHHHLPGNKSSTDLNHPRNALEYLIYNLNRNALYNIDQTLNEDNIKLINSSPISDYQRTEYRKHLKIPNRLNKHSTASLFRHPQSSITTANKSLDLDEDIFDESDFDTRSFEEQTTSFKSLSHILEENKPWITKLSDSGSIKHAILSSEHLQNTRTYNL